MAATKSPPRPRGYETEPGDPRRLTHAEKLRQLAKHTPLAHRAALEACRGVPGADPEDAAQEALVAIWRSLGKFDPQPGYAVITFVWRMVRNAVAGYVRRAARRGFAQLGRARVCDASVLADGRGDSDHLVDRLAAPVGRECWTDEEWAERLRPVRVVYGAEVLTLRVREGLSQTDAAGRLGLTQPTVNQIERAALAQLRRAHEGAA